MGCNGSKTAATSKGGQVISVEAPIQSEGGRAVPSTGFEKDYVLGRKLGSGSYSTVREATHVRSGERVAVKVVTKAALTQEDLDALYVEVDVLRKLDHPNVVKLKAFYADDVHFYLAMENMKGGELLRQIELRTRFTEAEARDVVVTLLKAIRYCHGNGVVHRDLKPENILLTTRGDDAIIKLADFGFAHTFTMGESHLTTCLGTPGYVAPEIITKQKYGPAVDIWSMGVIFYILLCGYPPFLADTRAALFRSIIRGRYEFHEDAWGEVSTEAKDFISKMLVVDPKKRATPLFLLQHPWIKSKTLTEHNLTHTMLNLKSFNARRRLKRAFHVLRAAEVLRRMSVDAGSAVQAFKEAKEEVTAVSGTEPTELKLELAEKETAGDGVAVAARVGKYGMEVVNEEAELEKAQVEGAAPVGGGDADAAAAAGAGGAGAGSP